MAVTLVPEDGTGLANANSYASLQEAKDYLEANLYSDSWNAATDDNKTKALVMSARAIDANFVFEGGRSSTTQSMAWPRAYVENTDIYEPGYYPATITEGLVSLGATGYLGTYWPSNVVPFPIKAAQIELARLLIANDRSKEDPAKGISSLSITGALAITFNAGDRKEILDDNIKALLAPFGRSRKSGGMKQIVRMQ